MTYKLDLNIFVLVLVISLDLIGPSIYQGNRLCLRIMITSNSYFTCWKQSVKSELHCSTVVQWQKNQDFKHYSRIYSKFPKILTRWVVVFKAYNQVNALHNYLANSYFLGTQTKFSNMVKLKLNCEKWLIIFLLIC